MDHSPASRSPGSDARRRRVLEPPAILSRHRELQLSATLGLQGHFTVEVVRASGLVTRRLRFANTITNAGLDALGTSALLRDIPMYCAVGTGNAAPVATALALQAEAGRTSANGGFADDFGVAGDGSYAYFRRTREFTESQVNNLNLSEVGFFSAASAGTMWTRQLLRDEAGVPATITKTSDERLRIVYEWRILKAASPAAQPGISVRGTSTAVTRTAKALSSSSIYWMSVLDPYLDVSLTAGPGASVAGVLDPYTPGSRKRTFTTTFSGSQLVGTISEIRMGASAAAGLLYGFTFAPAFAKANTEKMVVLAELSWAAA